VAGTIATAMYLDAKYHISKDMRTIMGLKRAEALYEKAGKQSI